MSRNPYGWTGGKARRWNVGYHAGREGQPRSANPYQAGMWRVIWEEGWREGIDARKGALAPLAGSAPAALGDGSRRSPGSET